MKREKDKRTRKPKVMSDLKKGELKDCIKCRFGKECSLPFPNEIEEIEEKQGRCIFFTDKHWVGN